MNAKHTYTNKRRTSAAATAAAGLAYAALLGTAPGVKADTYRIEIDYMVLGGPGGHSHQPTTAEVNAVIQMFACHGHTLVVDVDDAITHYNVLARDPDDVDNFFDYNDVANTFEAIKDSNFDNGSGWHYCIFGHQYQDTNYNASGSSGLGETGGDDFIVTLGAFSGQIGTPWDRAGTLAHEFGHNLGLTHCGDMYCGSDTSDSDWVGPRALNLPSIMSYFYQLTGVRTNLLCQGLTVADSLFKDMDYSNGTMCTLNEASLNEVFGSGMRSADWDCNGNIAGNASQDLDDDSNGWCNGSGFLNTLSDYDEWANISDSAVMRGAQLTHLPTQSCITAEEIEAYRSLRGGCAQPNPFNEGCQSADMLYVNPGGGGPFGTCTTPFGAIGTAQTAATPGSVLFLAPGTYSEGSMLLTKQMKIFSPGFALID